MKRTFNQPPSRKRLRIEDDEGNVYTVPRLQGDKKAFTQMWAAWARAFRTVFIIAVGVMAAWYFWPDKPIFDMPLAQLTLKDILSPIIGAIIVIGCFKWYFDIEMKDAHVAWGYFGIVCIVGVALLILWLL